MEETFVDWVYDTLTGVLREEYCLPEVENAFSPGMPCDHAYANVLNKYQRVCEKYGVDYDNDVEEIINSMLQISRELGQHRTIRQEPVAWDFSSAESLENRGILGVFPVFQTARMGEKTRHPAADAIVRCALSFSLSECPGFR